MNSEQKTLLELLSCGLGNLEFPNIPQTVNWSEVKLLSQKHGVESIALDGLQHFYDAGQPIDIDFQTKLDWVGCAQLQEQTYAKHEQLIEELAGFYNKHGIRMMVLKG